MVQKKAYHVLFIPEDHHKVRKFRFTYPQFRLMGAGVVFLVCFSLLASIGFFYYRSLYFNGQDRQLSLLDFDQRQAELLQKVAQLELTVQRTSEIAQKVETLVALDQKGVAKGFGSSEGDITFQLASYKPSLEFDELVRKDVDKMNAELGVVIYDIDKKAKETEERLLQSYEIYQDQAVYLSSTPSVWPVKGWVTSGFGLRLSPWAEGVRFHEGIDVAAQWGAPVYAPADGRVTYAGPKGGLGRTVIVDHGFGVSTVYGHLSRIQVAEGQRVVRGIALASVGNTGYSTGPHLHYEVHVDGIPIDPMQYLSR
ncbi:MAG: hypothetical protein A3I75_04640 [Deltaproteobacteria bacterium RIFCSPLOWO2_02_FULL_50_16]|nr:MAG: hypothetical protein A3B79_04980 [Deltaproteobacteria bacterium RIFCSPHIGHO2_02_FULL_50_15]OGQ56031.1 MAG: hypothetical protein A3I75_04640 [Deltaproteobacteria bacterium RIFCSPLOWO2_02_FULL_50_16]OGQ68826.1 MAG: hypothetical protein A3F89_00035 [Deltaproteobacteria bacterium RIFCSPLOWO2_12_FULL_50_11]